MPNSKRSRYLRAQRQRRARRPPAVPDWNEPGRAGVAYCEPCDLRFERDMNVLGLPTLELDWLDEDTGEVEHQSIPVTEYSNWFVPCVRCGGTATITNTHVGVDSNGDRWWYFAEPEQRAEISELLGFLRDESMSAEEVLDELEQRGPMLAALAGWLREQSRSLPRLLVEVVLSVLLTQLITGTQLTTDDLERILEEERRQHRQEQRDSSDDGRRQPGQHQDPPRQHQDPGGRGSGERQEHSRGRGQRGQEQQHPDRASDRR